ncbi:MAG: cyclic nucleotide-binding domain-containing protein [Treponema sp.]|nr:cyclic nucleotide-binding domain-containing protein [Treponema sp.]
MKADFDKVFPVLTSLPIFSDFADNPDGRRIMSLVFDALEVEDFDEGDTILKEGETGDAFYILRSGSVKVLRKTTSGDMIALSESDDSMHVCFGDAALMGNEKRIVTVLATSDCHTLKISGKKFRKICEREPVLGYRVFLRLATDLKQSIEKANSDIATLYEALFREIEGSN